MQCEAGDVYGGGGSKLGVRELEAYPVGAGLEVDEGLEVGAAYWPVDLGERIVQSGNADGAVNGLHRRIANCAVE